MKIYKLGESDMEYVEMAIGHRYLYSGRMVYQGYHASLVTTGMINKSMLTYFMYRLDNDSVALEAGVNGRMAQHQLRLVVVGTTAEIEKLIVERINRRPERSTFSFENGARGRVMSELMPRAVAALVAAELET